MGRDGDSLTNLTCTAASCSATSFLSSLGSSLLWLAGPASPAPASFEGPEHDNVFHLTCPGLAKQQETVNRAAIAVEDSAKK
eukprot:scaffold357498_cov19-Prasinocladus_malaysianus.AAC.1